MSRRKFTTFSVNQKIDDGGPPMHPMLMESSNPRVKNLSNSISEHSPSVSLLGV